MKKSKIKKIIRDTVIEVYGDAGYTSTADKFLNLFNKRINKLYNNKTKNK